MCSPEFQPKPWEEWRERLNKMSGGQDVYKEIYAIAREIPANDAGCRGQAPQLVDGLTASGVSNRIPSAAAARRTGDHARSRTTTPVAPGPGEQQPGLEPGPFPHQGHSR